MPACTRKLLWSRGRGRIETKNEHGGLDLGHVRLVRYMGFKQRDPILGHLVALACREDTDGGYGRVIVVGHLLYALQLDHDFAWTEHRQRVGRQMKGLKNVKLAVADDTDMTVGLCRESNGRV